MFPRSERTVRTLVSGLWAMIMGELEHLLPSQVPEKFWYISEEVTTRFLHAAKYNVLNAFNRIKLTIQWRHTNKADEALSQESELFKVARTVGKNRKAWVMRNCDDSGHAYVIWRPFCELGEDILKLAIYTIERALRQARRAQKIALIVDCERGEDEGSISIGEARRIARLLIQHYPDTLEKAIVVGSSLRQRMMYALFATVLPRETRKKVTFRKWDGYTMEWDMPTYSMEQMLMHERFGGYCPYLVDWEEYILETPWIRDELEEELLNGTGKIHWKKVGRRRVVSALQ